MVAVLEGGAVMRPGDGLLQHLKLIFQDRNPILPGADELQSTLHP